MPPKGSLPHLPNSDSISVIRAKKEDFAGKVVRVVGLVSRVNPNIMGKNWVHLLDDQGGELIASTSVDATLGSIVLAQGRIAADKTFNNGYYLPLLLEDAEIDRIDAGRSDQVPSGVARQAEFVANW